MNDRPPPYIPPYFGYERAGNLIKIYTPGKHLAGIVNTWEDYLAFIQAHTQRAEELHASLITPPPPSMKLDIDL